MRGLRYFLFLVLGTGLMAACGRDEDKGGIATAPSLASTGASVTSTISVPQWKRRTSVDGVTTEDNVLAIAADMVACF